MKSVYMCISTDIVNNGHIKIITRAASLGELTIGVMSDEAVAKYKRFPLIGYEERCEIIQNIKGVSRVVKQNSLDYKDNLLALKPDMVVHGDDWRVGLQQPVRARVIEVLATYGGELVEFPYTNVKDAERLESNARRVLSMPEMRRKRLKQLLQMKSCLNILEAHNGLTGLIVEKTKVEREGQIVQFDGMWVSSLCDSTAKGKPDIELIDNTSRLKTVDEIMDVTTKPIILDGDTGGSLEHFPYFVRSLERMGVSAVIIEDKEGAKRNSLFGTEAEQTQASITDFSAKIAAGRRALTTADFMIIARIESLILEKGMDDALARAKAFIEAGADGIMIHSRQKTPDEIFEFCQKFRAWNADSPLVVVPTTFNQVRISEWSKQGVNIVIHANHLIRSTFPAIKKTAETILANDRSFEADQFCMPIKDILNLIPESC